MNCSFFVSREAGCRILIDGRILFVSSKLNVPYSCFGGALIQIRAGSAFGTRVRNTGCYLFILKRLSNTAQI
jgi:hypothetical protein